MAASTRSSWMPRRRSCGSIMASRSAENDSGLSSLASVELMLRLGGGELVQLNHLEPLERESGLVQGNPGLGGGEAHLVVSVVDAVDVGQQHAAARSDRDHHTVAIRVERVDAGDQH